MATTPPSPAGDKTAEVASLCRQLLQALGEDVTRPGLVDTPMRMAKALQQLTSGGGHEEAVAAVGDAIFEVTHQDAVLVRDIAVFSMCEHHLLPFHGKVHVAYIPNGSVLGLSKLARVCEAHARRLQLQERLTADIADSVERLAGASGVAVAMEAAHMCMSMRGVEKPGAVTVTTSFRGEYRDNVALQSMFLAQVR